MGVGGSIHFPKQGCVEDEPVQILLRQPGCIQEEKRFSDVIHSGFRREMAEPVFVGCVFDIIDADFFRERGNSDSLKLCDKCGSIFFFFFSVGLCNDGGQFLLRHGGFYFCKTLGLFGIHFLTKTWFGIGADQHGRLISGQPFCYGIFVAPVLVPGVHLLKRIYVVQIIERIARRGIKGNKRSRGKQIDPNTAVLSAELHRKGEGRHDAVYQILREAVCSNFCQCSVDGVTENSGILWVDIGSIKEDCIFRCIKLNVGAERTGGKSFFQALDQDGSVSHQKVGQGIQNQLFLNVILQPGANESIVDGGTVFRIGTGLHRERKAFLHRGDKWSIAGIVKGEFPLLIRRKSLVEQREKCFIVVELAVKISNTVGGMVISFMIVFECIPGHVGYIGGVTAGLIPDGGAGKCGTKHIAVSHAVKIKACKHFRIDSAFNGQIIFRLFQAIAPGFFPENAFLFENHGVEAAVCIKIGIFQELFFRQARYRVSRKERSRHGIHESVVCLIHQVEEQRC